MSVTSTLDSTVCETAAAGLPCLKIAVVIVNWNGVEDTVECLRSLGESGDIPCDFIVVDNGSRGDDVGEIRRQFSRVIVLEAGRNLGFTGGNNLGIRVALDRGATHVFLLNNDTVVEPGTISKLVVESRLDRRWGILSPRIDYYDRRGESWFAGSQMDLNAGLAVHDNSRPRSEDLVVEIPWVTGCAMFCRAELLRELGGFDDRYFLNWEDVDLSLRCRALGWKIGLVPRGLVRHKVSRSLARASTWSTYYHTRNRLLLLKIHGQARYPWNAFRGFAGSLRSSVRGIRRRQPLSWSHLAACVAGGVDHLRGRYGQRL